MIVLGEDDPEELEMPAAPPGQPAPDPKVVAAQIRAQETNSKNQTALAKAKIEHEGDMAEIAARGENERVRAQAQEIRAMAQAAQARSKQASEDHHRTMDRVHDTVNQAADRAQSQAQHQDNTDLQAAAQFAGPFGETPPASGT